MFAVYVLNFTGNNIRILKTLVLASLVIINLGREDRGLTRFSRDAPAASTVLAYPAPAFAARVSKEIPVYATPKTLVELNILYRKLEQWKENDIYIEQRKLIRTQGLDANSREGRQRRRLTGPNIPYPGHPPECRDVTIGCH